MLTGSQAELTPSSDQPAFTFQLEAKSGKKHPSHEIEALTRCAVLGTKEQEGILLLVNILTSKASPKFDVPQI